MRTKTAERPPPPGPPDQASSAQQPPTNWPNTDVGNAERLTYYHGDRIRWVAERKKWFVWDGHRWARDMMGQVTALAVDTVRRIMDEAQYVHSAKGLESLEKWALGSESNARLTAMLAQAEHMLARSIDDFDARPDLFTCADGTIDLYTGTLREPHPEDYITRSSPIAYKPLTPGCDHYPYRWVEFLRQIMCGDDGMVDYLQRAIGYSMTGSTEEELMFLLWGHGKNGKSEFMRVLEVILGDYAATSASTTFTRNGHPDSSGLYNLAQLPGARLVTVNETSAGFKLEETLIKQVSSGDRIVVRPIYREPFEFRPTMKLWMATNHRPSIQGGDLGIWRRMKPIPFRFTVPEGERVKKYAETVLLAESIGILAWAVDGVRQWRERPLDVDVPDVITKALEEYRSEEDHLRGFLAETTDPDGERFEFAQDLRSAYQRWCDAYGHQPWGGKTFFQALVEDQGLEKSKHPENRRVIYLGIRLRDEWKPGRGTLPW